MSVCSEEFPDCPDGYMCNFETDLCQLLPPPCDPLHGPCTADGCCSGLKCFDNECVWQDCSLEDAVCENSDDCCGAMECIGRVCEYPPDGSGDVGADCNVGADCKDTLICGITNKCKNGGIIALYIGILLGGIILMVVVVFFIVRALKKSSKAKAGGLEAMEPESEGPESEGPEQT